MANVDAHAEKELPWVPPTYDGEMEQIMEKIHYFYSLVLHSEQAEIERTKAVAKLYARKRQIEALSYQDMWYGKI